MLRKTQLYSARQVDNGHIYHDNTLVNKEYSICLNCNMLKINGECLTVDSFNELRFLKGPENEPLSRDLKWDAL